MTPLNIYKLIYLLLIIYSIKTPASHQIQNTSIVELFKHFAQLKFEGQIKTSAIVWNEMFGQTSAIVWNEMFGQTSAIVWNEMFGQLKSYSVDMRVKILLLKIQNAGRATAINLEFELTILNQMRLLIFVIVIIICVVI
eukprot:NODE_83_length_22457_cov_0.375794.p10 type:complete len:139 gc:universal NODE_83_length_22457_cov_0.375794:3938-3522(-)